MTSWGDRRRASSVDPRRSTKSTPMSRSRTAERRFLLLHGQPGDVAADVAAEQVLQAGLLPQAADHLVVPGPQVAEFLAVSSTTTGQVEPSPLPTRPRAGRTPASGRLIEWAAADGGDVPGHQADGRQGEDRRRDAEAHAAHQERRDADQGQRQFGPEDPG